MSTSRSFSTRRLVAIAIGCLVCATPAYASEPPNLQSFDFNLDDFVSEPKLDDAELVWSPVADAVDYKITIHYGGGYGFGDAFVIPAEGIERLANGDLKFVWLEYQTNHPQPIAYGIDGIALTAIDAGGNESGLSATRYVPSSRTVIYGRVTDARSSAPLPGAQVDYRQWNSHTGSWQNQGQTATDADGWYYIVGLPYQLSASGAEGDTRLDVRHDGYQDVLNQQVILQNNDQIERRDMALEPTGNLLGNPGFEQEILSGPIPGPQNNWEPSDPPVARQERVVRSGKGALVINTWRGSTWHTGDHDLSWNAGDPVYASVWIKTNISPEELDERAGVLIQFIGDPINDEPVLGELKSEVGGTNNWRQLEVTGTAPAGTQQLRMRLFFFSASAPAPEVQIYFDDAVLEKKLQPPQPQTGLRNPWFSNGINDWNRVGGSLQPVASPAYNAPYAARATIDDVSARDYYNELSQRVVFGEWQPLLALVRVKTDFTPATQTARAGLLIEFYDASDKLLGDVKKEVGGAAVDWYVLQIYATTPAGTSYVRYKLFVYAAKDDGSSMGKLAYFDQAGLGHVSPPPPPAPGTNLLRNISFEYGLADWVPTGVRAGTVSAPVVHGALAAAMRIDATAVDRDRHFWSQLSQDVPVGEGVPLYASVRMQPAMHPLSRAVAGVMLEFFDRAGKRVGPLDGYKRETGGTQGWRVLELAAVTPPNTATARYSTYVWAWSDPLALNGQAYFDLAVLKQSTQPPQPQRALYTPGFENGKFDWKDNPYTPSFIVSAADKRAGVYGAGDTIEQLNTKPYYAELSQEITPAVMGTRYAGRVWIKPQGIEGGTAGMVVQFLDASGRPVVPEVKKQVAGTSDWKALVATGGVPPGTVKLRLMLFTYGDAHCDTGTDGVCGRASFDDAALYTFTPSAPP